MTSNDRGIVKEIMVYPARTIILSLKDRTAGMLGAIIKFYSFVIKYSS